MKTAEKEQLKTLNNSLVNYIDKVHELEQMVKKLSAANLRLCRKNKKVHPDIDIAAMFEAELKVIAAVAAAAAAAAAAEMKIVQRAELPTAPSDGDCLRSQTF